MKTEREDEEESWATENGSEPSPEEEDDEDEDAEEERGTDSDGEAWPGQEPNVDMSRKSHGGRAQWAGFFSVNTHPHLNNTFTPPSPRLPWLYSNMPL